jgi:glutathione synthase/RimK-type ligase-like ATP-grasp enzyme
VNAARGADVVPLEDAAEAVRVALRIADVLAALPDGRDLVEIGVDLVLDPDGRPWPIEVNGRPRGHLEALAASDPARWAAAHVAACARPLRWLASRAEVDGDGARAASWG